METSRFSETYTPPGRTRAWTRKTVIIAGNYKIQCCPFPEVDNELDYICKMAKQYIKNWRNPFATASWIHLLLARCHPFNDGNGRTTRLIASIPLMMHGYPPISIGLTQRSDYYNGINKVYDGDHGPLIQCILRGMEATIASVRSI
ncbi:fido domain-containing protein [Desarmillaria tabescens]|uniref:Fido domain-containing protein n=1 Tax=Armillaria tabescens TaxID=1929756 RepID=A0AA39MNX5_ARMTA|nr:fido domain-containing protein [Desarmillaria tabescens]KAK0441257.1 fido domain-containing protein [Desarmillaria tabescens]